MDGRHYRVGKRYYSDDMFQTWRAVSETEHRVLKLLWLWYGPEPTTVVTGVDHERGIITIGSL